MLLLNSFVNSFMCDGFSAIDLTEFPKWIEEFFNMAGQDIFTKLLEIVEKELLVALEILELKENS